MFWCWPLGNIVNILKKPTLNHIIQYPNKLLSHHYTSHLGLVSCRVCSRFETPGFIGRHEALAHREKSECFPENELKFQENEVKFQENVVKIPENEVKFPENEVNFPENEVQFPENEVQFPENKASVQEGGDVFEQVELGGGIKVGS